MSCSQARQGMKPWLIAGCLAVALAGPDAARSAPKTAATPVLGALQAELAHSLAALRREPTPPYFASYEITESSAATLSASCGALLWSGQKRERLLDVDLRVGDYTLDNTHALRGEVEAPFAGYRRIVVPLDDDPDAIRAAVWLETDRAYKAAVEQLTKVKTNVGVKIEEDDRSADFSREKPEVLIEPVAALELDQLSWEEKLRRYTAPFAVHSEIFDARADLGVTTETHWLVSSEGTALQFSQARYHLFLSAFTKADDGMELPRYESFFASSASGLPDDAAILALVARMIADLQALRVAPLTDPYVGPAILSGRAAGVFFHEIFGHRVEGHRQKDVDDSQTFRKKLNERILPAGFTVVFDPTLCRAGGVELMGCYPFDNQGVRAQRVVAVENGVLRTFLMSRRPIEGALHSNGHGRRQPGLAPVSRQSNLLLQVAEPVSRAELKRRLIEEALRADLPYGLLFDDIAGGFTMTNRFTPNAFNVNPIMVYRIYPDGREQLVRGVDLIGTPLAALSRIEAADDQPAVFNGTCGAESGGVPVSAVSPGLFLSQIEVQKQGQSQERLPILPAPGIDAAPEVGSCAAGKWGASAARAGGQQ
jgi:TldD protein